MSTRHVRRLFSVQLMSIGESTRVATFLYWTYDKCKSKDKTGCMIIHGCEEMIIHDDGNKVFTKGGNF
jgi:hypothetical protein